MSGFGGFGGFGQNNNQQQTGAFGGFGSTNTNTGFGSTNTGGFGSANTNTGGGLFGNTGSGGAFGSNNAFGAKPATTTPFGSTATTTGGSLFGSTNTATAGTGAFGGFGSSNTGSAFGTTNNTGGGLFGAKPAATTGFGAPAASTTPAFGGFGSTNNTTTSFGANATECQGTGNTPFQATVEKEPNTNTNQQNSFQSISFQQPYQKFSPEELRLVDYTQGRRFGNASNQPGAFGQNTGFGSTSAAPATTFGGFGSSNNTTTGTGLFGAPAATSSPFGASQPATSAFGTNTGTSLFGQNKPAATGGLFGQPAQQQNNTGGLFGAGGSTFGGTTQTTGFGAQNNTAPGTSLFGQNNAAKPAGFSFGTQQPASTGTGFGSTTSTTGGFGSGGGLFGNTQQNNASPFGGTQQAAPASNPFGGFGNTQQQQTATPSLFGNNNQQKPATGGLFGSTPATGTTTGTGLFGNTQQPAANPFGGSTNTQNAGGLFGGAKPATTGLFGSTNNTQTNTGTGSLFGNTSFGNNQNTQNQPQQNTSSLFGGQQKPATTSLFGQSAPSAGGSLFGNSTGQQTGLFGSMNNNNQQQLQPQPQQNSLFGGSNSLFNSQPGQQTPQSLTASINDQSAFGTSSLFRDLSKPQDSNPGPIATPLSSISKQKRPAALPMYKLTPASSSRFSTPQKRGFGFSYSNYGSPSSVSSTASTPGTFGNSLLSAGPRGLSKSMSTSSLRGSFNTENSLVPANAFSSPSSKQYGSHGSGSMKKLVINRGLRGDLFSPPPQAQPSPATKQPNSILKKRVSFDGNGVNDTQNGFSSPLKQVTNNAAPSAEDLGFMRPRPSANGSKANGAENQPPEMEQVKGNELAIVHEEEASSAAPKSVVPQEEQPGEYWMSPTKDELSEMTRAQRSAVEGFTVGRHGYGQVVFDRPVDLNAIDVDQVPGGIVVFSTRSCTVYPNTAQKPPVGKGLNVPSTISLTNSWPRQKDKRTISTDKTGPQFKKHLERLRKVPDTTFVGYEADTGIWTFRVEHFTTYGLPEDEDETDGEAVSEFGQSTLSMPPDTPTPKARTPRPQDFDESFASTLQMSQTESDPDDTFEFRKKKVLPGAFDEEVAYEDEEMEEENDEQDQQSFLDERSVGSESENGVEEPMDQDDVFQYDESVSIVDQEMAGSYPQADNTAEHEEDSQNEGQGMEIVEQTPGALLRARIRAKKNRGTPSKNFAVGDDWTSMLQTTISPQKQDRALLKSLIDHGNDLPTGADIEDTPTTRNRVASDSRGFANSIDLMNSLFGQTRSPKRVTKVPAQNKGFEWPYAKRPKTSGTDMSDMDENETAFHEAMKPSWGPDGTLVYAAQPNPDRFGKSRRAREKDGLLNINAKGVVSQNRDVRFAKFSNESAAEAIKKHKALTAIENSTGIPQARLTEFFSFNDFHDDRNARDPASIHEKLVWELASILWDEITVPEELQRIPNSEQRLRKDKLSAFWEKLVEPASTKHVAMARTAEEKAIAELSGHRIPNACGHLMTGKDYHLATLVALIGGKDSMRRDIREQLNEWQKSQVLSEFSQPIRAIYELLSGNVCVCDGSKGAIEDRIESFIISKRFGLDWRQAFGLRLWYSILATDDLQTAVERFAEDLGQERETALPEPWYLEQKIPTLWEDGEIRDRQDLLWGLLRLFTFEDTDLESILCPENARLSPLDARLSWQLSQALTSFDHITYGNQGEDKADRLTVAFAAQLTNEGSWLDAVFVLLHLRNSQAREKSIKDHVAKNAGRIGGEDSQSFTTLTQNYKIPSPWIWEAKALYMRSVKKDFITEVECLILAGASEEAHRTFSKDVAPKAVIERDYDTLRSLLDKFRGKEQTIPEWHLGGEVYSDYLVLLNSRKTNAVLSSVIDRLLAGLPAVVEDSRHPAFLETVAIEIISNEVAKTVVDMSKNGEQAELPKVLSLPLTEDRYLRHTVDLSIGFYRNVMATK